MAANVKIKFKHKTKMKVKCGFLLKKLRKLILQIRNRRRGLDVLNLEVESLMFDVDGFGFGSL